MQDRDLYAKILNIQSPWSVADVKLDLTANELVVSVERDPKAVLGCPVCGEPCPGYDEATKARRWRHLDTCQLRTIIEAKIPRVSCKEHKIHQIKVPWAEPGSPFTALFESMAIAWLRHAPIKTVGQRLGISWDHVDGIMNRAVRRGLERRQVTPVKHLGIDETSFQKHHEYVTILLDRERNVVIDVLDDRTKEVLVNWLKSRPSGHLQSIESVSMDMWEPYINSFLSELPGANTKICFDRYHVASHFGKALDIVRGQENKELHRMLGESYLKGTKHQWLKNSSRTDNRSRREFMILTRMKMKTARAWAIKETAGDLWNYVKRSAAETAWKRLLSWISRCQLKPVIKVGKMVKGHLWGILNAIIAKVTNAMGEAKNAGIQKLKSRSCGFRSRERFRRSILFCFGGLDLMPSTAGFF